MNSRENGQLPLAKRTGRSRISADIWEQIKTAYAAGIGLRETARNMNIPAGTVLARAKREGWTQKIQHAKALVLSDMQSNAIMPMQSAAATMRERALRHVDRMAGVTEKVLPHLETMPPDSILHRVDQVEKLDRIARRNYGLDSTLAQPGILNVAILTGQIPVFERIAGIDDQSGSKSD
jgi:gluconate kinase